MKNRIALLSLVVCALAASSLALAKRSYPTKSELITKSDIIALVRIGGDKPILFEREPHPLVLKVERMLKGKRREELSVKVKAQWERIGYVEPGLHLVFLKRLSETYVTSDCRIGILPVIDGGVRWYRGEIYGSVKPNGLKGVIREIEKAVGR